MSESRNKFGVKVGQTWVDNDERVKPQRRFKVEEIDLDYYPAGRAKCLLLGELKKGQRPHFYARLDRFNGNRRGYSLVEVKKKKAKKKAKATKKAAKKATRKKKT